MHIQPQLPSPREAARLLRGELHAGARVRCPGPGHSRHDRSLEVWFKPDAPGGFLCKSFADDGAIPLKDYVREMLGLAPWQPGRRTCRPAPRPARPQDNEGHQREVRQRRHIAQAVWARSQAGAGSLAETYLRSRGIVLQTWPATLRFLPPSPPKYPWPAMVAAFGFPSEPEPGVLSIAPADVMGVQLTYLRLDGRGKAPIDPDKISIGREHNAPIVLAPMNDLLGLAIAEGAEDALSAHVSNGLGAWAAGGAERMPKLADFLPAYTDLVTVLEDDNRAGRKGAAALRDGVYARGIACEIVTLREGF